MNRNVARRDLVRPDNYAVDLNIDSVLLGPDLYVLDVGCYSGDYLLDFISGCTQLEVIAGSNTPTIAERLPGVRLDGVWSWDQRPILAPDTVL
jgi:hypothetical protein